RKHRLPRSGVRLGVASNRIGVRIFELSGIEDPRQLDNAIRFRAQETLPIPLDEAVLDYRILSESADGNGVVTRRVLLVVAHRELVERYVVACRKAGIKLSGVDLEPFALLRALASPEEGPRARHLAARGRADQAVALAQRGRSAARRRLGRGGGGDARGAAVRAADVH